MNRFTKISILTLSLLLLGNLLIVGAKSAVAQAAGGTDISSAQTAAGQPACWVAVGNKIYFVEKDDSTILKVKASGAL